MNTATTARPRTTARAFGVLVVLAAVSAWLLPLNLTSLSSWQELSAAARRLGDFLAGFTSPDLAPELLQRCARLAVDTVAVALLGTAGGMLLAVPLAMAASRAVVTSDRDHGWGRLPAKLLREAARLMLDVLRGVPDFVWAIVLANLSGVSPVTGLLAISVSLAGILGKVLSEQWDNVPEARYLALRSTGASRLQVFFYGLQPLGARTTMSFVLMRTECAVRNASVIGVVGGGGLGAGLWDEYTDGNWPGVATMLLALLAVTASADLAANLVRRRLRIDPNHPRTHRTPDRRTAFRRRSQVFGAIALILSGCTLWLYEPLQTAWHELQRIEWSFVEPYTLGLFTPTSDPATWLSVARESLVPLSIAVLATLAGAASAGLLVFPASLAFQLDSARFTGERPPLPIRVSRLLMLLTARAIALVLRGVPEVGWLTMLAVVFRIGVTPCVLAIALHTAGVLHRVFTEAIDDVPYQQLERVRASRAHTFAYGALPRAWANWRTYAFFQFEVNMRIGVALGIVGAGGLGHYFASNLEWRRHDVAAAYLFGMILLTVAVDRLSRWLQLQRNRC